MFQKCQEHSHLLFLTEYENTLVKLRSELGNIIVEYDGRNLLISSMCFSEIWKIATAAARNLSNKRLEFDIDALKTFGLTVQENGRWLRENQSKLLLEDFWKQFVLTEYQRPIFRGKATFGENQILNELKNILHQVERKIYVLESEPIQEQQQPYTVIHAKNSQVNVANGNAIINATQTVNNGDIQEAITKFVKLLKESNLPEDFKEETIDLAEIIADQSKAGQPRKSIVKSLCDKLLFIKDPSITINAAIGASTGLYNIADNLYKLIKPFIHG
jgi:hypothetical protein